MSKFETLKKVYRTFGINEVISLFTRRLLGGRTSNFESLISYIENNRLPIIDEFSYSNRLIFNFFRIEYTNLELYSFFTNLNSRDERSFFGKEYDLGDLLANSMLIYINRMNPKLVLETGVAAGKSSSLILNALEFNRNGNLISIDITENVGSLIPNNLKYRWKLLIIKNFKKINFRRIAKQAMGQIDMFLHDSNHQPKWQIFEVKTILKANNKLNVIFVDDISVEFLHFMKSNFSYFDLLVLREKKKFSCIAFRKFNDC